MRHYHFTIAFYVDGVKLIQRTSYTVDESSRVRAWRKVMEYAIGMYGNCLYTVELHSVSTY